MSLYDAEQGLTGPLHGFGIFALFRTQRRLKQECVPAHDAVHGRTNFMAHDGKEVGLGLRRGLL